jgi:phage host-nuclease inhibitor protein Gam
MPEQAIAQFDPSIDQAIVDEVKAEAESLDVGELPATDDERELYRYLRRRGQLQSEIERVSENAKAMIAALAAKLHGLDFVYKAAAATAVRTMLEGKKAKSIRTPFGMAGFRKSAPAIEVIDEDALIAGADSNIDLIELVRVSKDVNRAAVAEFFKRTGEIPPGCEVMPEKESFFVK